MPSRWIEVNKQRHQILSQISENYIWIKPIFYLAINLGSSLEVFLISCLRVAYDYGVEFIIFGILMLLSIGPLILGLKFGITGMIVG